MSGPSHSRQIQVLLVLLLAAKVTAAVPCFPCMTIKQQGCAKATHPGNAKNNYCQSQGKANQCPPSHCTKTNPSVITTSLTFAWKSTPVDCKKDYIICGMPEGNLKNPVVYCESKDSQGKVTKVADNKCSSSNKVRRIRVISPRTIYIGHACPGYARI